jgi:uncharacterized protein YecA (UPF0149 family)
MTEPIPFEVEFPDEGKLLQDICLANSKLPKRDRIIVDFDTGAIQQSTVRKSSKDIGRNDPCPCGSGLKYKKCCIGK